MVADALEGKLKGARYDDAIWKAYCKASDSGKRKHERNFPSRPLFSELYNALILILTEMGYKDEMPTPDGVRRRLKILGWLMSSKGWQNAREKSGFHARARRRRNKNR